MEVNKYPMIQFEYSYTTQLNAIILIDNKEHLIKL